MVAVNALITRVGIILNDEANIRWTTAEVVNWFNEGGVALVKRFPDACTKTSLLQLVQGAKQTNPAGAIDIVDMRQNENGAAITPCQRAMLDKFEPTWMTRPVSGQVTHWMDDPQPNTFYVYPAQSSSPAKVLLTYSCVPDTMVLGGNITIRDIYQDNLVNYALYRAFSKDAEYGGDAQRAAAYLQLALGS